MPLTPVLFKVLDAHSAGADGAWAWGTSQRRVPVRGLIITPPWVPLWLRAVPPFPPPRPSQGASCGPLFVPSIPRANHISSHVSDALTTAFHAAVRSRPCGWGSRVKA